MGKAVEQGRGHLGITEDRCPLAEAQVSGDDDACAFVALAQQMDSSAPPDGLNSRYPNSSKMNEDRELI